MTLRLIALALLGALAAEPYPVGQEQGGSIGNRHFGHVLLRHAVTRDDKTGQFRYAFQFQGRTGLDARVTWPGILRDGAVRVERGLSASLAWDGPEAPAWKLAPITLEVRTAQGWQKVGTWQQKGPAPAR